MAMYLCSTNRYTDVLWEILKMIQDDYCIMMADGQSLDMTSVADLMDGRLVHTLCSLALDEIPEGFK